MPGTVDSVSVRQSAKGANSMMIQEEKSYIGIDISKALVDVYILPCKKYMQFKNDSKGIRKLIEKLKSFSNVSIVMEATGGYEKPIAQLLQKGDWSVSVVNPRFIRDFAKSLGKLAKTDRIDAEVIALFAEKIQPKKSRAYNENHQEIVGLNARRRQIVDMITMEKNRLDKASDKLKKSIQRIIKVLEKELQAINEALEKSIQNDADYASKNTLLKSIKGVGSIVAAGVIADLPELGSVSAKQISALAGLAPYNRDSGTLRGKRTTWGGRASVRAMLYMAALVAIRHNRQIKSFYERLCSAGKLKKVAITACMHKLLIIMNAMVKHGELWRMAAIVEI